MEETVQARIEERRTTQFIPLISLVRQHLEELSNTQTLLSSTRKNLLVERESLRTAGREVQQKRLAAGDAEAKFMKMVRQCINDCPGLLPTALLDAYERVGQTRDDLGEAEENYRQAEANLTGAEWTFLNLENRFYQFDIESVLLHFHLNDPTCLHSQPPGIPSRPALDQLPPCPAGSLSPSQVSKFPPPPPPPPHSLPHPFAASPSFVAPASLVPSHRSHTFVMSDIKVLKREIGQIQQKRFDDFDCTRGDEALFADGGGTLDIEPTTSTSEYSDVLVEIPTPKTTPQLSRVEEVNLTLNTVSPIRRHSHSTYSSRAAPKFSTPMRRTQTESAALFNRCSTATKQKIQAWSLKHLKESVIQKRLYLNTLEDNGVRSPVEGDWETRATHFWSKDSLTEAESSNEPYLLSASRTEWGPPSQDESATQSITSSVLMQHRLDGNLRPSKEMITNSKNLDPHEKLPKGFDTPAPIAPQSPPPPLHQIADNNRARSGTETVTCDLVEQQNVVKISASPDTVVEQPICTYLAQLVDAAQRKDSVQSTGNGHHPDCAMASKHDNEVNMCRPAQQRSNVETQVVPAVMLERNIRTPGEQSTNSNHDTSAGSVCRADAETKSNLDPIAQYASSRSNAQFPTPSALVGTTKLRSAESPTPHNPRPISQGRRYTTSWARGFFHPFKTKRSKSTPSVGELTPIARV